MEEFLYNIRMINNVLGHKVLESVVEEGAVPENSDSPVLFIQAARGANASGRQTSEGFVVFKGSQVADSITKSCPKAICALRDKLTASGTIDSNWIFTENKIFSSPSTAASVVMGRSANGLTEWRAK